MDTSQLMNHVVHRQLCYTLFTQVPIEPFFQLGLDFLFAGFLIIIEYRQLVSILSLVYLSSLTSKHARSYYIDNTLYHTTCRIRQIPSNSHHHK